MTGFTIAIKDAGSNFAAFAPDVPGCVARRRQMPY